MKYRTTFTCIEETYDYGLSSMYKTKNGNWEFELLEVENHGDDWGLTHIDTDYLSYPEKFIEKVE